MSPDTSRPRRRESPLAREWRPDISGAPILTAPLRRRLAWPFAISCVVVLAALAVFLGALVREAYQDRLTDELESQAYLLADTVGRQLAAGATADEIQSGVEALEVGNGHRITVVAADGTVIADNQFDPTRMSNHSDRPEIVAAVARGEGEATRSSATLDRDYLYVAVAIPDGNGAVARMAVPVNDVNDFILTIWTWIAVAGLVAIAATIAIAWFIAGRIVEPLEVLRQQAHAVARGDLTARIDPDAPAEFAEVGYAFNRMTEELQASHLALDEARLRLEAVLAQLTDGVVITDADGIVLRMNAASQSILGAQEAASIGKPFLQVSRDHELNQLLRTTLEEHTNTEGTVEHGLKRLTLLTTAQIVEDPRERLGLVVMRDISELRRLETVRREFVSNVSHELRTPLTSIRAMVETLEAGAIDDPATTNDFLGRIVGEVDRLNALVEDLLDLARLEAGRTTMRIKKLDPAVLVRHGADRLRTQIERANLSMDVEASGEMQPIPVDQARIEQVLINLVHNAIKFTPAGGAIHVRVSQDARETIIEVEDTGIGIEPAEQTRLFERFYKSDKARRSEGTGLGLAIAKHIVQAHGGSISVESEVGQGSTFRVILPNKRPKAAQRHP